MGLKQKQTSKLYYSIKEVSEMLSVSGATLRYWEKEFDDLRPRTSPGGTRSYSAEDIEYLKLIHQLLKERKMKIEGARKLLKENRNGLEKNQQILDRLQAIKEELLSLKAALDPL